MPKNVILSDRRDVPLLYFLWKWKVSTIPALIYKFFPTCKPKTAYNRLLTLRHADLITMRPDAKGEQFVCCITAKGFRVIQDGLPYMTEKGFKSEHLSHDLLVSAFHQGDWLLDKPDHVSLFSEQQLRRYDTEFYPDWVPKTKIHRPDGYTCVLKGGEQVIMAIEVELSQKRKVDYDCLADFYRYYPTIKRVLWLVPRRSRANAINNAMEKSLRHFPSPHSFILLKDFLESGWHSKIVLGQNEGDTLAEILSEKPQEMPRKPSRSMLIEVLPVIPG